MFVPGFPQFSAIYGCCSNKIQFNSLRLGFSEVLIKIEQHFFCFCMLFYLCFFGAIIKTSVECCGWSKCVHNGRKSMFLIFNGICSKKFNKTNKRNKKRKSICVVELWKISTKMMSRYKGWNYWSQIMKFLWNGLSQQHCGRQFFKNGLSSLMSGN